MLAESIKADLTEAAQEKLESIVSETVEKKIKKEVKKATKKLMTKIVLTGAIIAGVCLAVSNADKIIAFLKKKR